MALSADDQGGLLREEGVDVVEVQTGADCNVHEGPLGRACHGFTSEVV